MTGRVCPVHGEYAHAGICRWCEPEETPAQELARINAGVVGESPGARALIDVKRVAEMLGDPQPRWDADPPGTERILVELVDDGPFRPPMIVEWRIRTEPERTEPVIEVATWRNPPADEGWKEIRVDVQHAALRWDRVARRWVWKHCPCWMVPHDGLVPLPQEPKP